MDHRAGAGEPGEQGLVHAGETPAGREDSTIPRDSSQIYVILIDFAQYQFPGIANRIFKNEITISLFMLTSIQIMP